MRSPVEVLAELERQRQDLAAEVAERETELTRVKAALGGVEIAIAALREGRPSEDPRPVNRRGRKPGSKNRPKGAADPIKHPPGAPSASQAREKLEPQGKRAPDTERDKRIAQPGVGKGGNQVQAGKARALPIRDGAPAPPKEVRWVSVRDDARAFEVVALLKAMGYKRREPSGVTKWGPGQFDFVKHLQRPTARVWFESSDDDSKVSAYGETA